MDKQRHIWVNPRSPKASQLRQLSYDSRYASLVKVAVAMNSCDSTEEDVFKVLNGLGENPSEQDAVIVLSTMENPATALIALKYFQENSNQRKKLILYNVTLKMFRKKWNLEEQNYNITFSTIISCARMCSLPNKAVEWFEKMPSFGLNPDDEIYGALNIYGEMKALGAKPNLVICHTLLDAIGRATRPWQAKIVYKELIKNGFSSPNWGTYAALLRAYGRARYGQDALSIYREMKKKGLELNVVLYNIILAVSSETCELDSWTFSSLITIYSCSGKVSEAEEMLNQMLEAGFEPVFCGCLLNVMTQTSNEELGKLIGCIDRANLQLASVVKKPYCNCLIDLLEKACELLEIGLSLEVYTAIQTKSPTQWSLHLKSLSGSCSDSAALLVMVSTSTLKTDKQLFFESRLNELNAPFHEASEKSGWFLTTKVAATSWSESRKIPEPVPWIVHG
ncbi:hypothetical protein MKW98_023965 [Papaver atlanticum]|uniref:Pentatricopeptide repeat-containing protein n=1 Tax=Papaver atlanticum TaxID=357466 RepID=A0AAD4SZQ7_9MAGN|nr:hypothetical protein MKW98_023965 [Papaver atlanticum]